MNYTSIVKNCEEKNPMAQPNQTLIHSYAPMFLYVCAYAHLDFPFFSPFSPFSSPIFPILLILQSSAKILFVHV